MPQPIANGNSPDNKIKKAEAAKKVFLQKAEMLKKHSQQCKLNFEKAVSQAREAFKMKNVDGAMMYCITAMRQKKFEKKYLVQSDRFKAQAQMIVDAIMQYEMINGLKDVKEAMNVVIELNDPETLGTTVDEIRTQMGTLTQNEVVLNGVFDKTDIGSNDNDSDRALALELFKQLSGEMNSSVELQVPDLAKELNNPNLRTRQIASSTSRDTSTSSNAAMLSPL